MPDQTADVTQLLQAYGRGEDGAFDRLVEEVYDYLRVIARRQVRRGAAQTLNTIGLVHEAYLKMVDRTSASWEDRSHFYGIAANAMRQILVDHARRRLTEKRGSGAHHTGFDEIQVGVRSEAENILAVDQAMKRLEAIEPRLPRLVECRFFAGLTEEETAEALGVSLRTVQRDWMRARAWLKEEMGGR